MSVSSPTVSVIIPLYNKAGFIAEALESVFAQTYSDYEVIVVNDGSTDASEQAVAPYLDRIIYIKQENAGPGAARNRGIETARGRFIAFLDADDLWMPGKLHDQVNFMLNHPEVALSATNVVTAGPYRGGRQSWVLPVDQDWWICPNIFFSYKKGFIPCTPSIMVLATAIREVGGFPTDVHRGEDVCTWVKIGVKNRIALGRRVYVEIRPDPVGITETSGLGTREGDLLYERLRILALESGDKSNYDTWRIMLYRATSGYVKRTIMAGETSAGKNIIKNRRQYLNWYQYMWLRTLLFLGPVIRKIKHSVTI